MSFLSRIGKFAKTPQGKKLMRDAQELAKDPHTKQRIEDARKRLTRKHDAEAKPTKP